MKSLKQHTTKLAAAVLLLSATFIGCKKDNNSKPAIQPQISFGVKATNTATEAASLQLSSSSVTAASVVWTAGTANIASFKFEAKKNGVEREFSARGLTNVDLFSSDPLFIKTTIDTGTYNEIEIRAQFVQSSTSAIPLILMGTFTAPGGTTIPVEVDVNNTFEIKTEARNVFIDNTTDLKTTIIMHLEQLFQNITPADLAGAVKTSGTIVISSTSNSAIFNKALTNLQNLGNTEFEGEHHHNGGDDNGEHHHNGDNGDDHGGNSGSDNHGGNDDGGHHGGNENDG